MKKKNIPLLFVSSSTLIAGLLSYIYHPLMIQYLSIEDFGSFQSILSILNLLWVFIAAIGLYYVKEISRNIGDLEFSKSFRSISMKYFFMLSILIVGLFFLIIPGITKYLNIPYYYFILLGFTIISSFIAMINIAYLQSLQKFTTISGLIVGGSVMKLAIGFILVYFGFNIFGAIGGFILSQIIILIIALFILQKYFQKIKTKPIEEKQVLSLFLSQKKQILQYLFTSIIIALLMNIDILIVKNMFDGEIAGYYAAVSVLAKFLVFLGLSIETVYYPQLVKEKVFPTMQLLKLSGYYTLLTIGALIFFALFGETILRLFKDGLQEYTYLIFPLLVYCGVLSYLSIIVKTLIAYEKYIINYILGALIIGMIIAIYMFASTPLILAQIFMMFGVLGLGIGVATILKK